MEQTLARPEFSFTTLSLWLESGTGDNLTGTLYTELSWIHGKEKVGGRLKPFSSRSTHQDIITLFRRNPWPGDF